MGNFWDKLMGSQGKPVRRDVHIRLTVDEDGNPVLETVEGESFSLSSDGSIDRVKVTPDRFYHCGCSAQLPIGGRCAEPGCNRVSCVRCFGRCARCLKPICLEHSRFADIDARGNVRLCLKCHDTMLRKQTIKGAAKLLLSPFIEFKEGPK